MLALLFGQDKAWWLEEAAEEDEELVAGETKVVVDGVVTDM